MKTWKCKYGNSAFIFESKNKTTAAAKAARLLKRTIKVEELKK